MYERISLHLPKVYTDTTSNTWNFVGAPKYIMYANISPGQRFGIHTDTGCEYDQRENKYSKFTVLTYLNSDFEGGQTQFYDDRFNKTHIIEPRTNRTLVFDIDLFHSGEPVVSGSKFWIGTELVCFPQKSSGQFELPFYTLPIL
jgi:prolyl 4-hydroxylase